MRKAYLAIICLFTGFNAFAQHTDIQPVPQQISESGQLINKFPNKTDKSIYLKLTNSWEKLKPIHMPYKN